MLCRMRQLPGFVSTESSLAQVLAVAHMDPGLNLHGRECPHRASTRPATAPFVCLVASACPDPGRGKGNSTEG
jgi:hypothetical protein